MPSAPEWDGRKAVAALVDQTYELSELYSKLGFSPKFAELVSRIAPALLLASKEGADPTTIHSLLTELDSGIQWHGTNLNQQSTDSIASLLSNIRENIATGAAAEALLQSLASTLERAAETGAGWPAEYRKEQLDDLLWELLYAGHHHKLHEPPFRETVVEQISRYLTSPFMHTPWLTRRLVGNLVSADVETLARQLVRDPSRWTARLALPWGAIVPAILSVIFLCLAVGAAVALYIADLAWASAAVIAWVVWREFWKRWRAGRLVPERAPLIRLALSLQAVRDEITSGHYDPLVTVQRLKRLERHDVVVHSYVYSLLNLDAEMRAAGRPPTNPSTKTDGTVEVP
jgi:hypothetical protein